MSVSMVWTWSRPSGTVTSCWKCPMRSGDPDRPHGFGRAGRRRRIPGCRRAGRLVPHLPHDVIQDAFQSLSVEREQLRAAMSYALRIRSAPSWILKWSRCART